MQTGLKYELNGVVQDLVEFEDSKSGEKIRGVRVGWLGGSYYFNCPDKEEQEKFGPLDSQVRIIGSLMLDKNSKAKLRVGEIVTGLGKKQRPLAGA